VWLQQDFNIFVVGLFDTYHASRALEFQKHGLANLLEAFCDFIPDKRYQLADWRIRYVEIIFAFSSFLLSLNHGTDRTQGDALGFDAYVLIWIDQNYFSQFHPCHIITVASLLSSLVFKE
jgi:hypothetical protein